MDFTRTKIAILVDDLGLWVRTERGLVACIGCCHTGVVNTLNYILRLNPGSKIRAVVGGMHLMNASEIRLGQTIAALQSLEPDRLVACHCTGESSIERMKAAFGDRTLCGHSGLVLQFWCRRSHQNCRPRRWAFCTHRKGIDIRAGFTSF
jgi:7,8-dihydropterin-6-yl-methyl-4-(beta-D-ribofuranosyl)aminobenzene 5'-phosphate synthase